MATATDMPNHSDSVLDMPTGERPNPDEFIQAAMRWHFNPETGSSFWLERAKTLEFDPCTEVKSVEDLTLFPNIVDELRGVRAEDLIPRGYGGDAHVVGAYESGGTTGAPKRVLFLDDWARHYVAWLDTRYDALGVPGDVNWLSAIPSGPHGIGAMIARQVTGRGGINFTVDLDPRWVKKLIVAGKMAEADAYADHLIDQASHVLRTQDIGVLISTPPLLERLARHDELVELVNQKVQVIIWGGAHLDSDTRDLLRTDVFPGVRLLGIYGSTMILGGAIERPGLADDDPCIFDPFSPYMTFSVVDPATGKAVPYDERGQVVMNHVSKNALLPNNLERDTAIRIRPPEGQVGDSVADVMPLQVFGNKAVIEGVY